MKPIKRTKDPGTEFVIRHLKKIVRRSMQEEPVIKKQEPVTNEEGCKVFTYDSGAALKALEVLGKHLGMFGAAGGAPVPIDGGTVTHIELVGPADD